MREKKKKVWSDLSLSVGLVGEMLGKPEKLDVRKGMRLLVSVALREAKGCDSCAR